VTQLRDARLRKALDQAPDADLRPPVRTRDAIHAAAHGAVASARRRWWPAPGRRMPWSAALATVLLAGFITVLWQGQEVPGPGAGRQQADVVASAPAPAPAAAPPPATDMQQRAPAPASAPPPTVATAPAAAPARPAAPAARTAPAVPAVPAAPVARDEASLAGGEERSAAAPAPAPPAAAGAASPRLVPPVVPPPPSAAAPQRQAAAGVRAAPPAPPTPNWSQVRIEADGVSMVVPRTQAERLAALVTRTLSAPGEPGPAEGAPIAQLELGRGPDAVGVLSLHGDQWRWSPMGDPGEARNLRVDATLSNALLQEAQRMLQR
jgi:hypothetical protein